MTDETDGGRDAAQPDDRATPTMKEVDHTHPATNRSFGGHFTFARGGVVAADGGRPDVVPEPDPEPPASEPVGVPDYHANAPAEPATLEDVSHTPPNGGADANRVFERGDEHGGTADADGHAAAAGGDAPDVGR